MTIAQVAVPSYVRPSSDALPDWIKRVAYFGLIVIPVSPISSGPSRPDAPIL